MSFRGLPSVWKYVMLLLAVAVFALSIAWATNLVPYAAVWGSVADWVIASATVGALATIFVQVAKWRADQRAAVELQNLREREARDTRRREQEAFATSLGAEFKLTFNANRGVSMIKWTIRNASSYPMLNVKVMFSPDVFVYDIGTLLPTSDNSGDAPVPPVVRKVVEPSDFFIEYDDIWGDSRRYPRN